MYDKTLQEKMSGEKKTIYDSPRMWEAPLILLAQGLGRMPGNTESPGYWCSPSSAFPFSSTSGATITQTSLLGHALHIDWIFCDSNLSS